MKFSIGDLVIDKKDVKAYTSYNVKKAVGILEGTLLLEYYGDGFGGEINPSDWIVESNTREWRSAIERYLEGDLLTPEEVVAELNKLQKEKDNLNKEFDQIRSRLEIKLKQAASLVEEVGIITKTYNKELSDLKNECKPLYQALDNGGWSHSSMSC